MRRWKSLLFAAIPTLLLVGGLEGVSRLAISRDWLRGGPVRIRALNVVEIGHTLFGDDPVFVPDAYNGYRLRDRDDPSSRRPPRLPAPPKQAGEVRVLCLGDSVAYGIYLPEEAAWPARLQEKASAWAPPGTRIEIYNGAVPGYGPQQCKHLLQSRYMPLRPDVVLWAEEPNFDDTDGLPPVLSERRIRWTRFLCRSRFLYLLRLASRAGSSPSGFEFYNLPMKEYAESRHDVMRLFVRRSLESGISAILGVEYVADMRRSSSGAGPREFAGFVPHGFSEGRHAGSPILGNGRKWSATGLEYVACLDGFQEYPGGPGPLFLDRIHLTAAGSDFVASIVSEDLRRRWPEIQRRIGANRGATEVRARERVAR